MPMTSSAVSSCWQNSPQGADPQSMCGCCYALAKIEFRREHAKEALALLAAPVKLCRRGWRRVAGRRAGASVHLAFICRTVIEYGGNVWLKLVPKPSALEVTGTIFAGSVMEFVSSGLLALIVTACPLASTLVKPLISMRTGCAVPARFTIFK